jgi:thiamine-phosphate pyrophosphorylase
MAESPLLYYVTDRTALAVDEPTRRRCLLEKISEAARSGVNYIQLREKDLPARELESLAREAVRVIAQLRIERPERRTALLINSRADIALAVGADGVHLRSDGISPQDVKGIWKACGAGTQAHENTLETPLIGVSCHSAAEVAQAAANGATFAVFAPVFEKKNSCVPRATGLAELREACQSNFPVFALGGVTVANARSCLEAGAAGIAAIRLFQENDIQGIVRHLRK